MSSNPFHELYVGDRLSSQEFVTVFSPFLVEHAEVMFLPGNVVVTGVQGSGKSMLLGLLKPSVRLAYARAGTDFPVSGSLSRFIGAGVNLTHSSATDFGYRRLPGDAAEMSLLFGDFVNYNLVLDLVRSLEAFAQEGAPSLPDVGVNFTAREKSMLCERVRRDPNWLGFFEGCTTWEAVRSAMESRIDGYRRFLHGNDEFDEVVRRTKTAIGVPLSSFVTALKETGTLKDDVNVFLHIDQYEELANINVENAAGLDYRAIINRALARRDPLISYRVGSRGHAWHDHGYILGTSAKLEEERDFKFVNLDQKLRRHENRRTWIFPGFAADVFARRLQHSGGVGTNADGDKLMMQIFGRGLSPDEKARKYAGTNPARVVKPQEDWPAAIRERLWRLAVQDPLSARLGEAWYLQKGVADAGALVDSSPPPWEEKSRQYWRKERQDLALVQIAGRCQQRPIWCGMDDLIELSGGNILTFISICQHVWATWLQFKASTRDERLRIERIDDELQAVGVFKASESWLKKAGSETGRAGDRVRFVRWLGEYVARNLSQDLRMSNPGHNGFSLAEQDLDEDLEVKRFLEELSDYGNLVQMPHTTKEKDRRSRQKWYLKEVFCPQFKIPTTKRKESKYLQVFEVREWMVEIGILQGGTGVARARVHASAEDLPLFAAAKRGKAGPA